MAARSFGGFNEGRGPTAARPFVLGTCGGNTMKGTWEALVARHVAEHPAPEKLTHDAEGIGRSGLLKNLLLPRHPRA